MASYFLNNDGSISTKKKKTGNHYQLDTNGKVNQIPHSPNVSSNNTLDHYKKRKKELENKLLNYKREEKNPWWDKNDNIIENVGNIVYKLVGEKKEDRYKKDKQYDALEKEYKDINNKIDDYLVENQTYDKGILGYAQKAADVTAGNIRTSIDGINSTILKATGQKPVVYDSYAERVANKAISQSEGAEKVGLEITGSMARMIPQMIMPTKTASLITGFANYGGGAYNQAKKEGYDEQKATMYGATIGGLETGLQKLLGGFEKVYGKSIASKVTDKIMKKVISNSGFRQYITNVAGEFSEEYLQEFLDPIVRNVILEEKNGADFWNASNLEKGIKQFSKNFFNKENLYAGALGGLTSGIIDSPALFINNQTSSSSNSTKPIIPTVQNIVAQEKNSATASNAKIPRLTSETDSGTSSFSDNNITQSNDGVNSVNKLKKISKWAFDKTNKLKSFKEQIKDYRTNKLPSGTQLIVMDNSESLNYANIDNKPIVMNQANVKKILQGKHNNIDSKIIENLDSELNNTVMALDSRTIKNAKVIVLNQSDSNGNPIIATIHQGKTSATVEVNELTSVYDKNEFQRFINNTIQDGKRIYTNEKTEEWLIRNRLQLPTRFTNNSVSHDNNIPQINQNVKLPVISNNNTQNNESNTSKIMNPNEISKLTLEDANTTPNLPTINVTTGRGESKFAKNIENKTDMLTKESKYEILDSNEVKYYQEVTNEGSLKKAFERLNKGGASETLEWFNKDSEKATDVDVAEGWILLKQYQNKIQNATDLTTKDIETRNMVQVAKKLREMGTKAGQTVQAYNILNRLTPEGMIYYAQSELSEAFDVMSKNKTKEWIESNREKFNLTPQETEFIMKTMKEVQQMKDGYDKRVKLAEIQKVMTDKLPPSKGAGIKAWMRISMLFNPKTQVRNVMGNALIAPVNTFSDLFASVVDSQIAKKTGVRTTGTTNVKSYFKGFKEGAYQSYNDFKKGINTRNVQGNRFEISEGKSFNNNNLLGKGLNRVDSILSFMLDAGDRTFYEATFTNSINNQLKLNNKTEVTQDMIDIATTEALSRTWQDNNGYTRFVLNVRKGLNALNIGGYGLGDVLIPFAKTPANLTKAIVDYSPAGLVTTIIEGNNLRKSLTNGQYTVQMQHKFVQDLGKATAGSMLYILGYALAKAGINSGESDDDKDVANFLKNTLGVSSYSIKLGNKSFTYDWAQPIAAPFAMTANLLQKQKDGADLKESIISTLDTGLNVLFEQSFLESMSNVLSESGQIGTKLTEQILDLPSRAVPTLLKQIGDLIDPIQRTSFEKDKPLETSINKVKAKVPILSKTLAPSVDTMGREIQKYGGKNNIFNVFLNPSNVNTENISKSAEEIYRLYKSTGETNIMPRVAPYNINQSGEKILLSSEQKSQYQKISGNIIENSVKELLNKAAYKNLDDTEKADIINKIVGYSYNKAREEVLNIEMSNTYNKINQYIADGGKISDYYLNKEEIDYSYNNPEKYQVITQITNYDKYLTYQEGIDNVKNKYTNSSKRKSAVIKYVNSLNLSIPQKAMLIKLNYSSYDFYNEKIIQYINKQNLTRDEKTIILTKLGFTIRNGRVYS